MERVVKNTILAIGLSVAGILGSHAQQALWSGAPVKSPEVNGDNTVTFRLAAPKAVKVEVVGDFLFRDTTDNKGYYAEEMREGENGVWELTTPKPLQPELYSYSFVVDGMRMADPSNVFLNRDVATLTNIFLVGGGRDSLYAVKDVAHGTVARVWYDSPELKTKRRMTVYTPAGYESGGRKYPVLYLLHGMGGDEEAWINLGRTAQILDNLIASGKAEPMIVVMPNGNVSQKAAPGETPGRMSQPVFQLPRTMNGEMETSFPDIVKFVEKTYRVNRSKSARAVAGLSMGGFHALHISKQYPDMFGYVGLFSAAIMPDKSRNTDDSEVYRDMETKLKRQFANPPSLYWIGIGREDFLYGANAEYRALLDRLGCKYTYRESGEGHLWRNWRIYLCEFVPLLFKPVSGR